MRVLATTLILFLLAACAVGPDYVKPEIDTPDVYRFTDAQASDVINTQWWTQFDDDVLNELIDEALRANLDVRIAAARVEQFAARLNITRSDFFPQVGYGVSGDRQGISGNKAADTATQLSIFVQCHEQRLMFFENRIIKLFAADRVGRFNFQVFFYNMPGQSDEYFTLFVCRWPIICHRI